MKLLLTLILAIGANAQSLVTYEQAAAQQRPTETPPPGVQVGILNPDRSHGAESGRLLQLDGTGGTRLSYSQFATAIYLNIDLTRPPIRVTSPIKAEVLWVSFCMQWGGRHVTVNGARIEAEQTSCNTFRVKAGVIKPGDIIEIRETL